MKAKPSLGAFTIIKNEAHWVGFCLMACRPFVNEFVYFDGNSTDGTVELLKYIKKKYKIRIRLFEGMDPKDLQEDYVRIFNECLKQVKSDYAMFLHPDMVSVDSFPDLSDQELAYFVTMRSFAGEPGKTLYEIMEGRKSRWKSIMRNDLGLHYYGHYGAAEEDMYFQEITGPEHCLFDNFAMYPYRIQDSGIRLNHYSDVRPLERRMNRMATCLTNQRKGMSREEALKLAAEHPRVSFRNSEIFGKFEFREPTAEAYPAVFLRHAEEFAKVVGKTKEEFCPIPLEEALHV